MKEPYKISSKDDTVVLAEDLDHATAEFFADFLDQVELGKKGINDIGYIIEITDPKGEKFLFLTVPLLWKLGLISREDAVNLFEPYISRNKVERELDACADVDSSLIPIIDEIRRRKNG